MNWATGIIERLSRGEIVKFRPRGNSMSGKIENGQLVTVIPVDPDIPIKIGDIVLCKVKGNVYLHLVKAIDGTRYLIGNNHGQINGWTRTIYGTLRKIIF